MRLSSSPEAHVDQFQITPRFEYFNWIGTLRQAIFELLQFKNEANLLEKISEGDMTIFRGFEREFLGVMNDLVCENLGWTITHNEDLPQIDPDNNKVIYIGNHPTLTAGWPWAYFMSQNFAYNLFAIGKDDIVKKWWSRFVLGDLMQRTGKGVFIPRGKKERAQSAEIIRNKAKEALTPGSGGIIFPDAHRPYKSSIKKSQKQWDAKKPELNVLNWMTETCFPYSGGLWDFGQGTPPDVRFLDCTIVEPTPTHTFGGRLHFDVREISREELFGIEPSEAHLREKLVELWQRKNQMIRDMRM